MPGNDEIKIKNNATKEESPMAYETIKYEVAEQILTITLNRPDKLNAFNAAMQREMIEAFDAADKDDGIRAIIVTGAGLSLIHISEPTRQAEISYAVFC